MVISHKYRFIFIKTYKTAGTSIEAYLSGICGEDDTFTPITPSVASHQPRNYKGIWNPFRIPVEFRNGGWTPVLRRLAMGQKYYNHMAAAEVRALVPDVVWQGYYKFCVERNPWDRFLSLCAMLSEGEVTPDAIDRLLRTGPYCLNHPKYCAPGGQLLVDRVIQYDDLSAGLGEVLGRLGIPFDGDLGVKEKSGYRRRRPHYRDVLNGIQRRQIERVYAPEIEMHGYSY